MVGEGREKTLHQQRSGKVTKKIRVGVIFGGRSSEHEVSLTSASCVLEAIDRSKYDVVPIGITKKGKWLVGDNVLELLSSQATEEGKAIQDSPTPVSLLPTPRGGNLISIDPKEGVGNKGQAIGHIDVVFPVLHGTYGEDGAIQGLLELADLPYVGAGITGSAVAMDKAMAKAVFAAEGLPQLPYVTLFRSEWEENPKVAEEAVGKIGYPCFVKPASLGSSVGISKVREPGELQEALNEAAIYDRKFVIEKDAGNAREVECSVLGNDEPIPSIPGEIVPSREFYDYVAKYHDSASELIIPARITAKTTEKIQELAVQAFRALDLAGMARVDFFVDKNTERIYINEINSIPGFTPISMYPKLWEASGIPYARLIDRLIELAIERHQDKGRNMTSFAPGEAR
ncbi:MAG: D-alanine--D-alanine ligase [Firmicutes bacterium]|nr:D-alanine--D-alanine ligase [Bacillota bacterium]